MATRRPALRRSSVRRRNPKKLPASHAADLRRLMLAFVAAHDNLLRALQADGQNWSDAAIGSAELVLADLAGAAPHLQRAEYVARTAG